MQEQKNVKVNEKNKFIVEVPVKAVSLKQARFFVFRKLYGVDFPKQKQ
jgi:hypothetical protein